ncbi:MAG: hypothetical protein JWL77_1721 [Chthonomonadaceae bacterium]|nr:hypothetical protein [Chthonomonadaceae bacterium]
MTFTPMQTVRNTVRSLSSVLALTVALGVTGSLTGTTPVRAERRDTKDDTTYTLKRIYKTGEMDRYRLTTKINMDSPGGGGPIDVTTLMLMKDSTKEAKEDGSLTSISEFESASVTFNGMDLDITTMMPKVITTRDKNGKSNVKMEGGNEQVTSQIGDQLKQFTTAAASAFLPPKPVKVGDTWDMMSDPSVPKDQKINGKVTLVSVDTVKGKKVAKLKTVSDVTSGADTKIHTEATTLIDVETGKPLNATTKTSGNTNGSPVNIEMTLKMLGPDDKDGATEAVKTDSTVKKP